MKKITLVLTLVLITIISTNAFSQSQEDMNKWMAYMTPGEMHKMIAKADGQWNEELTMWMAPDAPPQKSTATCVNKMIMDGRYQESKHIGSFNGMPFEGYSLVGYDNARKVFQSTWIDNMGSGIMYLEGSYDPATKIVTLTGKQTDPITGEDMNIRETMKFIDDNTQLMEMYMTQKGKEYKSMEVKFSRKS